MVGHAGGDERMGELEEQRTRPGTEQQHRLAVQPPRLGVGPYEARIRGVSGVGAATARPGRRSAGGPVIRSADARVSIGHHIGQIGGTPR